MPIEIRELVIKATVSDSTPSNNTANSASTPSQAETDYKTEKAMQEVIRILKQKKER